MRILKQSTANNIMLLLVGAADHVTGLDGAAPGITVTLSKNGGSFATITPTITGLGSGWYNLALTTAHTDTIGDLAIHASVLGSDPADRLCVVESRDISGLSTDVLTNGTNILTRATQASVTAIPTNPILSSDARINNLDATISSRLATSAYTAPPATVTLAASQPNYAPAKASDVIVTVNPTAVTINPTLTTAEHNQLMALPLTDVDATAAQIDATLTASHGVGSWQSGSGGGAVVVPLVTGQPTEIKLTSLITIQLMRGDSYRVVFSLGNDYSSYTGRFGAKSVIAGTRSSDYTMPLRNVVWTNQSAGAGYFDLSITDTAVAGFYSGEIELTNGINVRTPTQYALRILDDIIK